MEQKLSPTQVVELFHSSGMKCSVRTLLRWRKGEGDNIPQMRFSKVGHHVWYWRPDVLAVTQSPIAKTKVITL